MKFILSKILFLKKSLEFSIKELYLKIGSKSIVFEKILSLREIILSPILEEYLSQIKLILFMFKLSRRERIVEDTFLKE